MNKSKGISPLTDNPVLGTKWFTNMYRELDHRTQYFRREVIRTTLKGHVINQEISESLPTTQGELKYTRILRDLCTLAGSG